MKIEGYFGMSVPAKDFREWADSLLPGLSVARIAELTRMKRTTVHTQLLRGNVGESLVVSLARALGVSPVDALSAFNSYADLRSGTLPPTSIELLSQIHYVDIFQELIRRSTPGASPPTDLRTSIPFDDSVRSWVDAIDPGALRHHLAVTAGVTEAAISGQLASNKLAPELAIAAAKEARVGLSNALVVVGLITEQEGGWRENARLDALTSASNKALLDAADYRLSLLRRLVIKSGNESALINSFWENLG